MYRVIRTGADNPDFIKLIKELDAYLKVTDGDEHDFYDQFNQPDAIKHVILLYVEDKPVACGAIKKYADTVMEIKRMFVSPAYRNKGYASKVLKHLELWAMELGYEKCILETGLRQREAIGLYYRRNYKLIRNYAPYENMKNSKCFEKSLI